MQFFFPNRTRGQIKTKFKREEKVNPRRITKALTNSKPFDLKKFEEVSGIKIAELTAEEEEEKEQAKKTVNNDTEDHSVLDDHFLDLDPAEFAYYCDTKETLAERPIEEWEKDEEEWEKDEKVPLPEADGEDEGEAGPDNEEGSDEFDFGF
eukprot:TRINITY_DN8101_c0_g1_i2.p1 TRINITY_DN8101_c0_g1~~TRINITY_DN8101_c0_g1_i2.p1  ORF type:complete len:151 (-),score=58.53 TRINITY_DN8101_c0_g1_i2:53-505(-)